MSTRRLSVSRRGAANKGAPLRYVQRSLKVRLVLCEFCKTAEEVPDYGGSDPVDPLIEELVMQHNIRNPLAHGGQRIHHSPIRLFRFDDAAYAKNPEKCLELAMEQNKTDGFTAWASEVRNTFGDDALKCFSAHRRPSEGCIDYHDDSKRLGRPTPEGRKVARSNQEVVANTPFLCDFCPVSTFVTTQIRTKAGLYT